MTDLYPHHPPGSIAKRRRRALAVGVLGAAVALSGCSSAVASQEAGGEGAGGTSVPAGSSAKEWQAALEDIEPVKIVYQAATPSAASNADLVRGWADKIHEYSNGNVTVEIVWNYGIADITESDEALLDGRIDSHNYSTFSSPSDFPINGKLMLDGMVIRDSNLVEGSLTAMGAMNQTAWETPEVISELTDAGLTPIMPIAASGLSGLACREPVTSLADLQGKQIRTGPLVQVGQVEALGATSVTLPFTELYEALQRGIVDCAIFGVSGLADNDLLSVAPHVITPVGTSLATMTASEVTGVNQSAWPLPVRQLLFDVLNEATIKTLVHSTEQMEAVSAQAKENGGGFYEFDDEVNEKLKTHNETVMEDLTATNLLDGEKFVSTVEEQFSTWSDLVTEAGYSTATLTEFDEKLSGKDLDLTAFIDIYRERVIAPNRPSK